MVGDSGRLKYSFTFTIEVLALVVFILQVVTQAFFITPAAEKTKTQGKNSSQKLKEKTQLLGGFYLQFRKLKKKLRFPLKTQNFLRGGTFYVIFINKNIKKWNFRIFCEHFFKIQKNISKNERKSQKTWGKNSKLKQKTQNSRKKLNVSEDCPSLDLPSGVKKRA